MAQEARVTLTDLPVEILDAILENLDIPSLLALGKVSHSLSYVVLHRTVPPAILERLSSHSEFTISPDASVTLIPAVAAVVWTPKVKSITYLAERDEERHFLDDMRGLSVLLSRLAPGSLESLRVRIAFDYTNADKARLLYDSKRGDWPKVLSRLLEAAISACCNQIEISNGRLPGSIRESFSIRWRGPSIFARLWENARTRLRQYRYKPPPPTALGSKTLVFETPLFFTDYCIVRTMKDLRRASRTIQHLTISPPEDPYRSFKCDDWTWVMFAISMRLPHLTSLTLKLSSGTEMSRGSLFEFLSHHPNITFLVLDFSPRQRGVSRFVPSPEDEYPILPKLESLEARPQFIPWIVSFTARARKRGKRWQPSLTSVRILTKNIGPSDGGASLDEAILSLNTLLPPDDPDAVDSAILSQCPSLTLEMNFEAGFWIQWIRARATRSSPHAESRITDLILAFDASAGTWSPLGVNIRLVGDWLAVFPKLRHLEILGQPFSYPQMNERLCEDISDACSRSLRTLKFNDSVRGLARIPMEPLLQMLAMNQ